MALNLKIKSRGYGPAFNFPEVIISTPAKVTFASLEARQRYQQQNFREVKAFTITVGLSIPQLVRQMFYGKLLKTTGL